MKKLFIALFIIFSIFYTLKANAVSYTPIRFIYINGANNNTPSMQKWFFDGINKLHPEIKHQFETSPFIIKNLLKNGEYVIEDKPSTFFWGDKSLNDLNTVNEELITTSMLSPYFAQMVRSLFAHCMHDAIWVQKDHNMQVIVRDLHKEIMKAYHENRKVILFGYSAGSFITYEYFFYKLPAIQWKDITTKLNLTDKEKNFAETHKINNTCLDAIISSNLAVYATSGDLVCNLDFEKFKKSYLNMNKVTREVCTPADTIMGTINYASPLVLFYSDIQDPTIEINQFNRDFFTYIKNNDMFWLTVNFADDPLGFPVTKNLTVSEIETKHNISFNNEGHGFFHDKSDVKSPATFLGAHTSYWKYAKKFSKVVADAYKEGYINFYSEELL